MSQETQNYKEINATSYNKLGHATRGPSLDGKTEKEIPV
jgi:hypothetical protein